MHETGEVATELRAQLEASQLEVESAQGKLTKAQQEVVQLQNKLDHRKEEDTTWSKFQKELEDKKMEGELVGVGELEGERARG